MKNYKKNSPLTQIQKILFLRKYNGMNKIFPKINLKFYSIVTAYNQIYEYV